jgi:transcriptional regulator with XRE-family HTH domain
MTKSIQTVGTRLKELRRKSNYNQLEISKIIGVSYTHVARYEKDVMPDAIRLDKLAQAYGTTIDFIVRGKTEYVKVAQKDTELVSLFKKIELLSSTKKKVAKELIEAFIFKAEIQQKLAH